MNKGKQRQKRNTKIGINLQKKILSHDHFLIRLCKQFLMNRNLKQNNKQNNKHRTEDKRAAGRKLISISAVCVGKWAGRPGVISSLHHRM